MSQTEDMHAGTISVVIPAFNAARTLTASLNSALQQTRPPLEVIVIDNNSSDGTADAARNFADSRVRVISCSRAGAGAARNVGATNATGDLIAFLDADDRWHPEKLSYQVSLLDEGAFAVGALMRYVSSEGKVLGRNDRYSRWPAATTALRRADAMPLAISSWLIRRADFLAVGGFNEEFVRAQDFEFAVRFSQEFPGLLKWPLRKMLLDYQIHAASATATSYNEQFLAAELVRRRAQGNRDGPRYAEFMAAPNLTRDQRRTMESGRYYRQAAVAKAERRPTQMFAALCLATLHSPLSVVRKLAWSQRDRLPGIRRRL